MYPSGASWNTLLSQVPMQSLSLPVCFSVIGGAVQSCSVGHCHDTLTCWGNWWLYNSLGELFVALVPLSHLNFFHRRLLLNRFPFLSTHPCRPKLSLAWGVVCLSLNPRRCTAPYSPSGNYFAIFHFLVALTFRCCGWSWLMRYSVLISSSLSGDVLFLSFDNNALKWRASVLGYMRLCIVCCFHDSGKACPWKIQLECLHS